jgi:AraC-like DNA-binding protein
MALEQLTARVESQLAANAGPLGVEHRPLPDVLLLRCAEPTPLTATLYEPVVCVILRGAKQVLLGETAIHLGRGDALVVSHDLPVVSQVTTARPGEPYLAIIAWLDVALLRSLYDEVGSAARSIQEPTPQSLAASQADPRLLEAIHRYIALADDDIEAKVLAASVRRELHFRLLMGSSGAMLRSLLRHDSHASMIARAITRIRVSYREPLVVTQLAKDIGMSPSSLHKHFRAITETSPLQYQKELRLLEARRLLMAGHHAISDVAYEVGYESPNQFSREYARKYGVPPSEDLRIHSAAAAE